MPQTNNITIQFKADGDNKLLKALKDLATAQRKLNKEIDNAGNAVKQHRQRVELNSRTLERNNSLVNQAKAGIAQYRNTLLLGAFAMGLFSKTVGKLTTLFAEQEAAEKKLSTALGFVNQELLDFASTMQEITTFGDEVTISAMAQAAAFTTNTEAIKQMTIVAQDFAAARGVDLKTAMDLISKSVFSSTNALSRYGIEIDNSLKGADRFNAMMKELNQKFGGQASAQLDTYGGAVQSLKNAFGDLGETLGRDLAEALLPIVEIFRDMTVWLSDKPVGNLTKGFTALAGAILLTDKRLKALKATAIAASASTKKLAGAFGLLKKSMKFLGKAGLVFMAIEGIGSLFKGFSSGKEEIKETVKEIKHLEQGIADLDERLAVVRTISDAMNLKKFIDEQASIAKGKLEQLELTIWETGLLFKNKDTLEKLNSLNKKKAALTEKLNKLSEQSVEVESLKNKMELQNLAWQVGLIPNLEKQVELLDNKNKFSGVELELANLLAEAEVRDIGIMELDINTIEKLIKQKIKLTNVMKTELFITSSFNQALVQGINNNFRFAESFGNMIKKMAAEISAHMATFLIFKSIASIFMPDSNLFPGFTNPWEYAISKLTGTTSIGAGSAMQGVALESQNAAMQGGSGSVVVNFSGNVMSEQFIEEQAIPQIKEALRLGENMGVS